MILLNKEMGTYYTRRDQENILKMTVVTKDT